ncbi:hypothetical protein ACFLUJ_04275 [Chloroflexota bacterium]
MWKLKGCPRCGGDLLIEKEMLYGWNDIGRNEKCIQCSFTREFKEIVASEKVLVPVRQTEKKRKRKSEVPLKKIEDVPDDVRGQGVPRRWSN